MWCDHCKEEIIPLANKENGDVQECPQCGKLLFAEESRESKATPDSPSGTSSIAQTAHALLKRWEESRPVAGSSATDSTKATASEQVKATAPANPAPKKEAASREVPVPVQSKTEPVSAASANGPNLPDKDIFDDIPSGLDVSEMLPDLVPPVRAATTPTDSSKKQSAGSVQRPVKTEAAVSRNEEQKAERAPATSHVPTSAGPGSFPEKKTTEKTQAERKQRSGKTSAMQNDAGALLNRGRKPISQPNESSYSSHSSVQTGAVASPEFESEKPDMFKTKATGESEAKVKSQPPAQQMETNRGRVRFTTSETSETQENKIDDLGIQQAIESHYRRQRNWSVLFAQLLVYGGALAMTCGFAIVIGNRFGSLEIAETTGWLTAAGGHLLFILGIYTHLSNKMDQVWNEMHARHDELTRLLTQKINTANQRKKAHQPTDTKESAFQRSSLSDTVREVA